MAMQKKTKQIIKQERHSSVCSGMTMVHILPNPGILNSCPRCSWPGSFQELPWTSSADQTKLCSNVHLHVVKSFRGNTFLPLGPSMLSGNSAEAKTR